MASRQDVEKRQLWAERLRRYRASGLTVTRFCASERVSVNTFFYWAKRLGTGSATASARPRSSRERGRTVPHATVQNARSASRMTSASSARLSSPKSVEATSPPAVVRFQINAAVEIAVPAECLDVIRCLADCLHHARGDRSGTFQEVVVATR